MKLVCLVLVLGLMAACSGGPTMTIAAEEPTTAPLAPSAPTDSGSTLDLSSLALEPELATTVSDATTAALTRFADPAAVASAFLTAYDGGYSFDQIVAGAHAGSLTVDGRINGVEPAGHEGAGPSAPADLEAARARFGLRVRELGPDADAGEAGAWILIAASIGVPVERIIEAILLDDLVPMAGRAACEGIRRRAEADIVDLLALDAERQELDAANPGSDEADEIVRRMEALLGEHALAYTPAIGDAVQRIREQVDERAAKCRTRADEMWGPAVVEPFPAAPEPDAGSDPEPAAPLEPEAPAGAGLQPSLTIRTTSAEFAGCPDSNFPDNCHYLITVELDFVNPLTSEIRCRTSALGNDDKRIVTDPSGTVSLSWLYTPWRDDAELTGRCTMYAIEGEAYGYVTVDTAVDTPDAE